MEEGIIPHKDLTFIGMGGCETYIIDDSTIGVRPKWISVEEQLPEKNKEVLVHTEDRVIFACWDCEYWYDTQNWWIIENITHWMPIPKPSGKIG